MWSIRKCFHYRPQRSCGKVMFSQAFVIMFRGVCVADTPLPQLRLRAVKIFNDDIWKFRITYFRAKMTTGTNQHSSRSPLQHPKSKMKSVELVSWPERLQSDHRTMWVHWVRLQRVQLEGTPSYSEQISLHQMLHVKNGSVQSSVTTSICLQRTISFASFHSF